jgi:hypothetical protein
MNSQQQKQKLRKQKAEISGHFCFLLSAFRFVFCSEAGLPNVYSAILSAIFYILTSH